MLNLFLKDLRAGAFFLWAAVPVYVLIGLQVFSFGSAFFWGTVVSASLLLIGTSALDWRNGADLFVHSLPVTRAAVVRARYLTAAAAGLLALALGAALGIAAALILDTRGIPWPRWVAADVGLSFVVAYAVVVAVYLPCHFRWGFGRGNLAAALALAAMLVLADAARTLAPAVMSRADGATSADGLPLGQIPTGVALIVGRLGLAPASLLVVAASVAVLWLSSEVAVRAARRREF